MTRRERKERRLQRRLEWAVSRDRQPARATLDALKAAGYSWGRGAWVGRTDALPDVVADAARKDK